MSSTLRLAGHSRHLSGSVKTTQLYSQEVGPKKALYLPLFNKILETSQSCPVKRLFSSSVVVRVVCVSMRDMRTLIRERVVAKWRQPWKQALACSARSVERRDVANAFQLSVEISCMQK